MILTKSLIVGLILFSEFSFAEDYEDLDIIENEEILEQEEYSEDPVEIEEADDAQSDDAEDYQESGYIEEDSYEENEEIESRFMDMDSQERERAQNIEALDADYAKEQREKNSSQNYQDANEVENRNNRSNRIYSDRPKREKAEKDNERSQREERRAKRATTKRENIKQENSQLEKYEEQDGSEQSTYRFSGNTLDIDPENVVCDPIVFVQVQNKLRFDILKELADEHGFEIAILESENKVMSLEKNQPLSKVVESITRDMSVVLNFQTINDCKRLIDIAVLDNNEWSGSRGSFSSNSSRSSGENSLQRYKPKAKIQIKKREQEDVYDNFAPLTDEELAAKELQEEQNARRLERKNLRSLNDELVNGDQLKAQYNVRGDNWKKDIDEMRVEIPDMEQYVQEVIDGERQPDLRKMSIKQRSEYMKIRRELRTRRVQ